MGVFDDNVARSNNANGMMFQHEAGNEIVLRGLKLIKNRYKGLYLYSSYNITLADSIFVDNTQYGIHIQWVDNVIIENTNVKGISSQTKALVKPPYFNKPCVSSFYPPVGLQMPTGIHKWDRANNIGATLNNVQFADFDHSDECSTSVPISFNYDDNYNNHFDYTSMFTGVTFDGMKLMDTISSNQNGVKDIVIHDIDGSSDKTNQASSGMIVSNVNRLKAFAPENCVSYADGISYCANTCYRTVSFMVDQAESHEFDVRITRLSDAKETIVPFSYKYEDENHEQLYAENFRFFSTSLPQGSYSVEFVKDLQPQWPRFVLSRWEGIPSCSGYAESADISIFEPIPNCDNIILNGDMEQGLKYWKHENNKDTNKGELLVVEEGLNGSKAIRYVNRSSNGHGIGQNLDSRCLKEQNTFYEIELYYRLIVEGTNSTTYTCNPFSELVEDRCPYVTLRRQKFSDEKLITKTKGNVASTIVPNDVEEMSIAHGVFRVDEGITSFDRIFMVMEQTYKERDMIVDNVSVKNLAGKCNEELVRNGDFEANSRYWGMYGDSQYDIEMADNNKAMKVFNRNFPEHGIRQDLYIDSDCFNVGDRFEITGE